MHSNFTKLYELCIMYACPQNMSNFTLKQQTLQQAEEDVKTRIKQRSIQAMVDDKGQTMDIVNVYEDATRHIASLINEPKLE